MLLPSDLSPKQPQAPKRKQPPSIFPITPVTDFTHSTRPIATPLGQPSPLPGMAVQALSRATAAAQTPNYPLIPGIGADVLAKAGTWGPISPVSDAQPAPIPAPPAPSSPTAIQPVPISKVDGQGRLRDLMKQAYRGVPGESADALAKRIQALNDFSGKIDALGQITPEQADAIFNDWYQGVMQPEAPFARFSPEAQQALQDAYGGTVPQPRTAGWNDVDQHELGAVAAYTLVNALTGKGNFGDILKGAAMVQGHAQRQVDQQTQALQQQDEMRRKEAIDRFKRIGQIEDFNNEQRGYEAKGVRDAQRNVFTQNAITDRTLQGQDKAFHRDMAGRYFDYLKAGDSDRAAIIKRFAESQLGMKLDDSFNEIPRTSQEASLDASAQHTIADTQRIKAVTRGLGFKNDLDEQAFQADLATRVDKRLITHEQLDKIRKEVDHLPEKWREEKAKNDVEVETSRTRANAALLRAQKAGSGSGSSAADKESKRRLDGLKSIVSTQNTIIDNLNQQYNHWYKIAADLDYQISRAQRRGGDFAAKVPELQRQKQEAVDAYTKHGKDMADARKKSSDAADEIDKITMGGKP